MRASYLFVLSLFYLGTEAWLPAPSAELARPLAEVMAELRSGNAPQIPEDSSVASQDADEDANKRFLPSDNSVVSPDGGSTDGNAENENGIKALTNIHRVY